MRYASISHDFESEQLEKLWDRLERFFDNLDGKMTAERYFSLCEQMGKEPKEEEIPPEFQDFPTTVQYAISIYNQLGDRVVSDIGFLGKDYTKFSILLESYLIDEEKEKDLVLEIVSWLENRAIKKSSDAIKRQRDKMKNKKGGATPKPRGK